MRENYSTPSNEVKEKSTLMELKDAFQKLIADKSALTQSEIIISVGNKRNKLLLISGSYNDAIVLIDKAQEALDSVSIGTIT